MNDIDRLQQEIDHLKSRVIKLENLNSIRDMPYGPITIPGKDSIFNKCSKCGIDVSKMTHYVCYDVNCPSGLSSIVYMGGKDYASH